MSAADTARAAFDSAREEIMERLKMREKLSMFYLGGTVLTLFLSAFSSTGENAVGSKEVPLLYKIVLTGMMPGISVIIAASLAHHISVTNKLANFIRHDLNNYFISVGEWAPTWDFHTRYNKVEKAKSKSTRLVQVLRLHVPTFVSLAFCFWYSCQYLQLPHPQDYSPCIVIAICMISPAILLYALYITWNSYRVRFDEANKSIKAPPGYDKNSTSPLPAAISHSSAQGTP